jgi:hypothetical protein
LWKDIKQIPYPFKYTDKAVTAVEGKRQLCGALIENRVVTVIQIFIFICQEILLSAAGLELCYERNRDSLEHRAYSHSRSEGNCMF